jgi:hypothetical protein
VTKEEAMFVARNLADVYGTGFVKVDRHGTEFTYTPLDPRSVKFDQFPAALRWDCMLPCWCDPVEDQHYGECLRRRNHIIDIARKL